MLQDQSPDDCIQCHPVMKEAGKGGWGSGVKKDFLQNQSPSLSLEGQTGIIRLTKRGGRDSQADGIAGVMIWRREGAWPCSEEMPAVL